MVLYFQTDKIDVFWILLDLIVKKLSFFLLWSSSCDCKMKSLESNLK